MQSTDGKAGLQVCKIVSLELLNEHDQKLALQEARAAGRGFAPPSAETVRKCGQCVFITSSRAGLCQALWVAYEKKGMFESLVFITLLVAAHWLRLSR